mmetsp:Transcript_3339/g.11042  ORF Transcript_3339/g.11042 Transcript_3339/m.11042 type:complete len:317 (-) Transcript_3339:300-1250(-)
MCCEDAHDLRQLALLVLDPVRLVDDQVAPHQLGQRRLLGDGRLIRGQAHVERTRLLQMLALALRTRRLVSAELDRAQRRAPPPQLAVPVGEHRFWDDDQVRPRDAARLLEVCQERDGLQRLAQPHLVGEDAVEPVVVAHRQPAQPVQLVVAHHHRPDLARLAERLVQRHRLRAALLWQLAAKQAEHLCVRRQVGDTLLHRGRLRRLELLPPPRPHRLLGARHARLLRRRRLLLRRRRLLRRPLPGGKRGVGGSLAQLAVPHGPLALLHVVHVLALDGEPAHHHRRGLEHPPAPPLLPCRRAGGRRRVAGGGSLRGA